MLARETDICRHWAISDRTWNEENLKWAAEQINLKAEQLAQGIDSDEEQVRMDTPKGE